MVNKQDLLDLAQKCAVYAWHLAARMTSKALSFLYALLWFIVSQTVGILAFVTSPLTFWLKFAWSVVWTTNSYAYGVIADIIGPAWILLATGITCGVITGLCISLICVVVNNAVRSLKAEMKEDLKEEFNQLVPQLAEKRHADRALAGIPRVSPTESKHAAASDTFSDTAAPQHEIKSEDIYETGIVIVESGPSTTLIATSPSERSHTSSYSSTLSNETNSLSEFQLRERRL
ncbi:hypothetical protein CANCADRAFT_31381 [Tortispora caseinolytica NRRL Y-17796]|uniref:Uncharacterized protein n=1 Tax=Tortispora caseinolytica NRRL Y-17796 TaxID=767744 RepID=A0A1E4TF77_9ASCO|nr:hypothetical protein CANCADRAFT_31381 [Tortispora caseinolytica NRRL Y-17796]